MQPEDAAGESRKADWQSRVISGRQLGGTALPEWAESSYLTLRAEVTADAYPCYFGVQAEKRGEMFYAFVKHGESASLVETMACFAQLAGQPQYEKHNIAVFFEPDTVPLTHAEYHRLFWKTLQLLHDADCHPHADAQPDPDDPAWEFSYRGVEMFVVCACPSFDQRRSRNLGPGMVLLFQPRSVFIDKITNKVIGQRARHEVRKRLLAWDKVSPHPDLGFFGDPGNFEWKQYFLPDDNRSAAGKCPFSSRASRLLPLTPLQEGLWFLWQFDPDGAAGNLSATLDIAGLVDTRALHAALLAVLDRHPVLRTRFLDVRGMPRQSLEGDAKRALDWYEHDLRDHCNPVASAADLLRQRGGRKFDLRRGGLVRATLLHVAPGRCILQLCTHQIVADAYSLRLMQQELLDRYALARAGDVPALRAPPSFGEYVERVRARLDDAETQRQLGYWLDRLGDPAYVLELPGKRTRSSRSTLTSDRLGLSIASDLQLGVQRLARDGETTPFLVMLSAFAVLLGRYSGLRDVRIAVPMRMDNLVDSGAVGPLTNMAVIRLDISAAETFSSVLGQARRYVAEACAHADLPFTRLVKSSRVHRSLSNAPLCQVSVTPLPAPIRGRHGELDIQPVEDDAGRTGYWLSLNIADDSDGISTSLRFSPSQYDDGAARQLMRHYVELLEQIVAQGLNSDAPLAGLGLSEKGGPASRAA